MFESVSEFIKNPFLRFILYINYCNQINNFLSGSIFITTKQNIHVVIVYLAGVYILSKIIKTEMKETESKVEKLFTNISNILISLNQSRSSIISFANNLMLML